MATKKATKKKIPGKKASTSTKKDIAAGYNQYKIFKGQQYTGMKIGRSHKWYYDKGEWHDKKITPDLWEISFEVVKRRAGKAPKGSGVPVGTEYHWYILAHQMVKKLNANDYSTRMEGYKYKLAHKRFDKAKWNISDKAQRKRLIKILNEMVAQLEKEPVEVAEKKTAEKTERKTSPERIRRRVMKKKTTSVRRRSPARRKASKIS